MLHDQKTLDGNQASLASALTDLTYRHSDHLFGYLVQIGVVREKQDSEGLWVFLEIVAFIDSWVQTHVIKRAAGRNWAKTQALFSALYHEWGLFFAGYPEGPNLEGQSVEGIESLMAQRAGQYRTLYKEGLDRHGLLHGLRRASLSFLENVYARFEETNKGRPYALSDDMVEHISGTIGAMVGALCREVDVAILESGDL
jgi:hypothetical protein